MKAALVIDLPPVDDLGSIEVEYNISYIGESQSWEESGVGKLRLLPKKLPLRDLDLGDQLSDHFYDGEIMGWNDCIDAITGEAE